MKTTPILWIAAILAVGVIGFFIGKNSASGNKELVKQEQTISKEKPAVEKKQEEKKQDKPTETAPVKKPETQKQEEKTVEKKEEKKEVVEELPKKVEPVQPVNPTAPTPPSANGAVLPRVNMGISDDKISRVLESISKNMENKKLAYVSSKSQDCSGIYHQMKDSIQKRLPALKEGVTYHYPKYTTDRSSRQIADWYYKNGNLLIVKDPVASRNSIRPGTVLFFGRAGEIFKNITIDMLTDRKNNYTKNGAIQHIAVVTSIKKDKEGNTLEYTMMHARYPGGPPASRSGSKEVQSNSAKNKAKVAPYPFGHWTQQLVAVANIATKKS